MSKKCLMLKLPDNRELFTHEKNQQHLSELSKTFGVRIFSVDAESPSLLSLDDIAKHFCDQSLDGHECRYQILSSEPSTKILTTGDSRGAREKMLQKVCDVRSFVEQLFLEGKTVSIKELHHRFSKHGVAVSTLYRHVSFVKKSLEDRGHRIEKVRAGIYQLA